MRGWEITLLILGFPLWFPILVAVLAVIFFGAKRFFGKKLSSITLILISAVLGIGVSMLASLL